MAKEYFILRAGRTVCIPSGFYTREDAETVAKRLCREHPGATYSVVWKLSSYSARKPKKLPCEHCGSKRTTSNETYSFICSNCNFATIR